MAADERLARPLYCALCCYTHHGTMGPDQEALTITSGHASCHDHLGYLSGAPTVSHALITWKRERQESPR